MSYFTLRLKSGKEFKGNITASKQITLDSEDKVLSDTAVLRHTGKWEYENKSGFLSIDSEIDPEDNFLVSVDVLIENSNLQDVDLLQESVGTELIINDYIVKNFKNQ